MPNLNDAIRGCFYGGAIGDCMGSLFENTDGFNTALLNYPWRISDDTQLTLATTESILIEGKAIPGKIAANFVHWFNQRKITGIGSSTLKAMQHLQVGAHWALAGREGEYAAGNGAAMRVAPLAFIDADRQLVRDICRITHKNDEAYTGGLAIIESIRAVLTGAWSGSNSLIGCIVDLLPDTQVRDRLISLKDETASVEFAAKKYGNSGYVVHSVPLAVYAAQQVQYKGFEQVLSEIIKAGGDTDTNCSMAGSIMGAFIGSSAIPHTLLQQLQQINEFKFLEETITAFVQLATKQSGSFE